MVRLFCISFVRAKLLQSCVRVLLIINMFFPIPQSEIEEPSLVCFGTMVNELNISVMQAFIGLTPLIRFNDRTRSGTNR